MKLKLTVLAAALSFATTAFAGETQQTFNAADMQQLFGQKSEPAQLATLSQKEMKETEGAAAAALPRPPSLPTSNDPTSMSKYQQEMLKYQQQMQNYNRMIQMLTKQLQDAYDTQKRIIQNFRT